MCEPLTIAATTVAAGGQIMGAVGAKTAADKSAESAQTTADSIAESYDKKVRSILLQAKQAGVETSRQQTELQKQYETFEGIIQTTSAFGGVSGASVSKMKQASAFQIGEAKSILGENMNNTLKQLRLQAEAERAATMSQINQVQSQVMAPPSPFATALSIGSTVLGGVQQGMQVNAQSKLADAFLQKIK